MDRGPESFLGPPSLHAIDYQPSASVVVDSCHKHPPPANPEASHRDVENAAYGGRQTPVTWRSLPSKGQLAILAGVRLVDFFQVASLQTYMFHQLKSFNPALSNSSISLQAGVLQGVFTAAQILTAILWGRVADAPWAGRKRVLLIGLIGTGLSCVGVGYSFTFEQAVVFRCIGGAVNGTVGATRTMVAESVDKKYHSLLGGVLADPAAHYPNTLGPDTPLGSKKYMRWLHTYPYAAPNFLSAAVLLLEAVIVWLFLQETLDSRKHTRDRGIELADTMRYWLGKFSSRSGYSRILQSQDAYPRAEDDVSPHDTPAFEVNTHPKDFPVQPLQQHRLPLRKVWTTNVLLVLLVTAVFDFQMGGFANLWLLFLSSPRDSGSGSPAQDAIHFSGGLAFSPALIGRAMAILGAFGICLQFSLYPTLSGRWGLLRSFQTSLFLFPLAYILAPYLSLLPSSNTAPAPAPASGIFIWSGISLVLFFQVAARTFALPATIILLNNASPHPSVLGTIHGLGSSVSSTFRTIGPIAAGRWFGIGLHKDVIGLAWWALAAVSAFGAIFGFAVKDGTGHEIRLEGVEEDNQKDEKRGA
ncbi:MAG: hypothetical protein Q9160_003133 [Pyrenula sp. 1 TL-2023]